MSIDKFLDAIFKDIRAYCVDNHLQLHMNALTKILLGCEKTSAYPSA
jgi:hypothetical protein